MSSCQDHTPRFWYSPTWGVLEAPYNWDGDMWMQVLGTGTLIPPPPDAHPLTLSDSVEELHHERAVPR